MKMYLQSIFTIGLVFLLTFCTNYNLKMLSINHKVDGDYLMITKNLFLKECGMDAKTNCSILDENNNIIPLYFNNYYDNNRTIKKTYSYTYYDKNKKGRFLDIPIYKKYLKNKKLKVKFSFKVYQDKMMSLHDFINMKSDTINMKLLPNYVCDDLKVIEEEVITN